MEIIPVPSTSTIDESCTIPHFGVEVVTRKVGLAQSFYPWQRTDRGLVEIKLQDYRIIL